MCGVQCVWCVQCEHCDCDVCGVQCVTYSVPCVVCALCGVQCVTYSVQCVVCAVCGVQCVWCVLLHWEVGMGAEMESNLLGSGTFWLPTSAQPALLPAGCWFLLCTILGNRSGQSQGPQLLLSFLYMRTQGTHGGGSRHL